MNGRAARSAISLGLNLRALGTQIDPVSKETRTRIWWSIFSLEHLLAGMTGRSASMDHQCMSLHPPVPEEYDGQDFDHPGVQELLQSPSLREERLQWTIWASDAQLHARKQWFQTLTPSPSLYFFHHVDLSLITHAALSAVYSLTASRDRETTQSCIRQYQEKLNTWLATLLPPFAFDHSHPPASSACPGQISLALAYYSSQTILTRPGLMRPEPRRSTSTNTRFANDTAETCVYSSIALISILPDTPSTHWMLTRTPWWSILHFIMQALTVLLLQLSISPFNFKIPVNLTADSDTDPPGKHVQGNNNEPILSASKKALLWLHHLARDSPSASRAFDLSAGFLRRIGEAKGLDLHGIPIPIPTPSGSLAGSPRLDRPRHIHRHSHTSSEGGYAEDSTEMNWGADCTSSEWEYEQGHEAWMQQPPFLWEPALFLV